MRSIVPGSGTAGGGGGVAGTHAALQVSEVYRIQGDLLVRQSAGRSEGLTRAEHCFTQALAIAREQQAKSHELKAATSLAGLRRR